MASNHPQKGTELLHQPRPTAAQLWPGGLVWALWAALAGAVSYAILLAGLWMASPSATSQIPLLSIATTSGVAFAILAPILFVSRLCWLSRSLADHAFAVVGFVATFFGLAMLLVFFFSLARSTYLWLEITPKLMNANNEKKRRFLETFDKEAFIAEQIAPLREVRDKKLKRADTKSQKQTVRREYDGPDGLIEYARRNAEKTAKEKINEAKVSIREDTSTWAIITHFLTSNPSSTDEPQNAGIYPALLGSLWLALITMLFAVPVGVGAALYLEEYRTKSWIGNVIQVNINNLAGIPSVVYGILGGFVFVGIFKKIEEVNPAVAARNVLGGGLTLGLLTLPIVIVSAQEAIRAVPKSIREGAYALGATQWQVIRRNVLPMASPGILTGTILSISRAIGEAAPLVMFGALLYVDQEPSLFSRFTALPMQIFGWAERYEIEGYQIWQYNAGVASAVLLMVLLALNAVAIFLRNRTQKRMRY